MPHIVSIIVVTLNEARHIPRLKTAIDDLDRPDGFVIEAIVVDGGSSDATAQAARDSGFSKVIVLPNASIPICRNRGLAEARGELIAFLDGDCEPAKDWLVNALPHLATTDPVIIGWPVEPPKPGTWVQRAWHTHWMFKVGRSVPVLSSLGEGGPLRHSGAGRPALPTEPIRNDAFRLITTRNMLLTRTAAAQLGGFDENLPTGEDTDFVFRAYAKGIRVLGVPSLRVIHHGEPATLRDFFRQQLWHANRSSYAKIMNTAGTCAGRNAVIFSWAFTACLALCLLAIPTAIRAPAAAVILLLPIFALLAGPALLIGLRAGKQPLIPALVVLYATYGFARMLDLLGWHRVKRSWKADKVD